MSVHCFHAEQTRQIWDKILDISRDGLEVRLQLLILPGSSREKRKQMGVHCLRMW